MIRKHNKQGCEKPTAHIIQSPYPIGSGGFLGIFYILASLSVESEFVNFALSRANDLL